MVEQKILDDYTSKDWIGVRYREPMMEEDEVFPTVIRAVSNRNQNPLEDCIEVSTFPEEIKRKLKREFIKEIWHIDRVYR